MPISETKKAQDLVREYKVRLEEALKPNAILNQRLIRVIGLNTEVLLESLTQTAQLRDEVGRMRADMKSIAKKIIDK